MMKGGGRCGENVVYYFDEARGILIRWPRSEDALPPVWLDNGLAEVLLAQSTLCLRGVNAMPLKGHRCLGFLCNGPAEVGLLS